MLREQNIGACIVTGTHFRKTELDGLHFLHCAVPTDYGQRAAGKIRGGLLIPIRQDSSASKCELAARNEGCIETCSIRLPRTKALLTFMVITGVYIAPRKTKECNLEVPR